MEHTAKNFVLQLGSLIALYVSLSALISVAFGVINFTFPDELWESWRYENAATQIRFGIALLIVFFPTYIVLTRMVNQSRRTSEGKYLTITKWLIYLSLLVGGGVLLGDLVSVIWTFLNGEITSRFLVKAFTVLFVVGAAFKYYLFDVRGYWNTHESKSKMFGALSTALVIAVVVLGFYNIETPSEVREQALDEQQITDFTDIEWRVLEYYRVNDRLPQTLEMAYGKGILPAAPEGREMYTYRTTSATSFELCGEFARASKEMTTESIAIRPVLDESPTIVNPYNWDHGEGSYCFERVIK